MHCEPTCMYVHCTLSSIATSTCCLIFGYTLCTTVSDMLLVLSLGNQLTFTRKPHVIKHVFAKTELFNSSMIDIYMHIHACEDSSTMAVETMNIRPSKSAVMVTDTCMDRVQHSAVTSKRKVVVVNPAQWR